jgi:hypothetical protein
VNDEAAEVGGEKSREEVEQVSSDGGQADAATPAEGDQAGQPSTEHASEESPEGWYQDPNSPGQERYWDGSKWTKDVRTPVSTTKRSPEERKAMLAQQVQQAVSRGLRVESQSDFQAILVQGKPVNHTLHAILTIFTCLLWGIVWAVVAATGGEKREMIVIDEFGNVQHQRLGKV